MLLSLDADPASTATHPWCLAMCCDVGAVQSSWALVRQLQRVDVIAQVR